MDKNMKRQLVLSMSLIGIVILTLWFWYDNFVFHTYVNYEQSQVCFSGGNNDLQIESFELYQNKDGYYYGNQRMMSLKNDLFKKDDIIELSFTINTDESLKQVYKVKNTNEVILMDLSLIDNYQGFDDLKSVNCHVVIKRHNECVYDENVVLNKDVLVTYTGNNKDYSMHNVYVTSSWLKTGILSFDKNIVRDYDYIVMDYLVLKDGGDIEQINDYERFAHIVQKSKDVLKSPLQQAYFYDGEGSLLDKEICLIVSLKKDEKDQNPLVFKIDLHKALQEGDHRA